MMFPGLIHSTPAKTFPVPGSARRDVMAPESFRKLAITRPLAGERTVQFAANPATKRFPSRESYVTSVALTSFVKLMIVWPGYKSAELSGDRLIDATIESGL
jgi:hypothetical protein